MRRDQGAIGVIPVRNGGGLDLGGIGKDGESDSLTPENVFLTIMPSCL